MAELIHFTCKEKITKNFTISSWVYLTGAYYTYVLLCLSASNFIWNIAGEDKNYGQSVPSIEFDSEYQLLLDPISLNKWVYVTCVNHNNNLTVYYDGKKQGTVNYNKSLAIDQGGCIFSADYDIYNRGIYGYIFDFFISNQAIWLKDFTPPIRPFDDRSLYLDTDKNIWGCRKI